MEPSVTKLNMQAFIVTLATLSAARGIASLWSGGYAIPLAFGTGAGVAPQSFKDMFAGSVNLLGLDIPVQVFYFIGVGIDRCICLETYRVWPAYLCRGRQ